MLSAWILICSGWVRCGQTIKQISVPHALPRASGSTMFLEQVLPGFGWGTPYIPSIPKVVLALERQILEKCDKF